METAIANGESMEVEQQRGVAVDLSQQLAPSSSESSEDLDEACGDPPKKRFMSQFLNLVSMLRSLDLLHFFADHAVIAITQIKVRQVVRTNTTIDMVSTLSQGCRKLVHKVVTGLFTRL